MDSPLVVVFLAVIALTALLQAGFVGAIAFAMRAGNRKLADIEGKFEQSVVPQIRSAAKLTAKAAAVSEKSLAQALRVDTLVADASRKAERYLDEATVRLEGAVERAAVRMDSEITVRAARARDNRILRKLSSASAFVTGLQRALEVWQATAAAAAKNGGDEDEDEDAFDDDGGSRRSQARLDHRRTAHAVAVRAVELDEPPHVGRERRAAHAQRARGRSWPAWSS